MFRIGAIVDKITEFGHIAPAVKKNGIGPEPVAPGPAGFLIVAFDVLWQIGMDYKPYIGFVDPHPEGDGCHNDFYTVMDKIILYFLPHPSFKAGMIALSLISHRFQVSRHHFG